MRGEAVLRADDSAAAEGRGATTTAGVFAGRVRFARRHARRLQAGCRALGLPSPDTDLVLRALGELAEAAFGSGDGAIRLTASRDSRDGAHLVGVPRALGDDPPHWRAVTAPFPHPGPLSWGGAKIAGGLLCAEAARLAREAGADEALLCDADGRLVEGARTNLVAVDADGRLRTPPLARGAVAGLALGVLLERVPELAEHDVAPGEIARLRELVAVNAVRGARPITHVDGAAVGDGRPGEWAARLGEILARDDV
jgi:branched-subunit amino acid aminotransferase/4-amino-4-deoxychorismate lyase